MGAAVRPITQLAFSAPGDGVHSVWVNGVRVVEDGHVTVIDEAKVLADGRQAGLAVIARVGLPNRPIWPVQ